MRYESECRDTIYRVSTKILALRKIIFIHEISNADKFIILSELVKNIADIK
ncbi:hypothetical protein NIES4106_10150 [Fischerella sp. NIES-4106]|jgi:hypothetical protein|nr:hypothetical protein NIES4106_10150 [Fischerella sp. NIES-4106]